ncbi:uncharacterized protein LOC133015783 [Limanda limanda]|uniref:uncharacterized protein LOC133015783 n=1 Tax=Limanda limanda TaxID=27771 RepID=UPI0029C84C10|nr:uncharacterized protein LOC133015783 [Limanda limanda]
MAQTFNGKPGDLIEIFRKDYKHWAVYIGGQMVVHFVTNVVQSSGSSASLSSSIGKVKREKLTDVVGNDRYQVNNLLDDKYEDRKLSIIVKEACKMVGRELQYNLATYNSEHFATEMRYGKALSLQINEKPGDLIEINRGPYHHWAVYIGENEVVHFTTDGVQSSSSSKSLSSRGEVKREKLADVVGIHHHIINNLLDNSRKPRDPSVIVKEACEKVDSKLQYDVKTYNCEHFATEMRYGKAESLQCNGKPGDLIEIFRKDYQHWAVYIGGNEVVHFGTEGGGSSGTSVRLSSSKGYVLCENFADVVGSDPCSVNNLLDDRRKPRDPSIIVKEACAMVGRELKYNLVTYNCEHFATEMRYGKAESLQVIKKLIKGAKVVGASVVGASAVGASAVGASYK